MRLKAEKRDSLNQTDLKPWFEQMSTFLAEITTTNPGYGLFWWV
jgi:hypothetical protein